MFLKIVTPRLPCVCLLLVFFQGAIQGPEEFVEGMALGVKALVGGAVGELLKITSESDGGVTFRNNIGIFHIHTCR